jgi:hypothetical protein
MAGVAPHGIRAIRTVHVQLLRSQCGFGLLRRPPRTAACRAGLWRRRPCRGRRAGRTMWGGSTAARKNSLTARRSDGDPYAPGHRPDRHQETHGQGITRLPQRRIRSPVDKDMVLRERDRVSLSNVSRSRVGDHSRPTGPHTLELETIRPSCSSPPATVGRSHRTPHLTARSRSSACRSAPSSPPG